MFKPDDPTAASGQYTEGVPGGALPTELRADHLNAITNEIVNAVEGAGLTLAKADSAQLYQAIGVNPMASARMALLNWASLKDTSTANIYAFAANGNIMIAVGASGMIFRTDDVSQVASHWTVQTQAAAFAGSFYAATFSAALGLFIIAGTTGEIQTSPDGVTWTHRTAGSSYAGTIQDIAVGSGIVVFVGTGGEIQSSTNGTAWTRRVTGAMTWTNVVWSGAEFITFSVTSADTQRSTNGTTWAAIASQFLARSAAFGNGIWVSMVDGATTTIRTSTDGGLTWTAFATTFGGTARGAVRYLGGSLFVMLVGSASGKSYITDSPAVRWLELIGLRGRLDLLPNPGGNYPFVNDYRLYAGQADKIYASLYF